MKLLLVTTLWAVPLFAQENLSARDPRLNEGQMFAVKFEPGGRKLVVTLAGAKGAEIGPDKVEVFGRVIGKSGEPRQLEIRPSGSSFVVKEPPRAKEKIEIEVRPKGAVGVGETHMVRAP